MEGNSLSRKMPVILFLALALGGCDSKKSAQLSFRIVDENGAAVESADVSVNVYTGWKPGEGFGTALYNTVAATSRNDGHASANVSSTAGEFSYLVKKSGFYETRGTVRVANDVGQWIPPVNPIEVELRRIKAPIGLIAVRANGQGNEAALKIPVKETEVGFDLERCDWVAPHGSGKASDVLFRMEDANGAKDAGYDSRMRISFARPQEGICVVPMRSDQTSKLQVPHLAPQEGYLPRWESIYRTNDKGERIVPDDSKTNFFVRTRVELDEAGTIARAQFGKIYGMEWWPSGDIRFRYYFNPQTNDRNLEFDRTKNLWKGEDPLREP